MRARSTTGLLMRLLTLVVWLLLLAPFALSGCTSEPPDPRFAEPEATVRTLFTVKDHLRYERSADGDTMRVIPMRDGDAGHPIVLRRTDAGWKIALRESVPDELRQRLYRVYEEARQRERG